MYSVSDNVAYAVLAHISPATFALLWNSKTVWVALMLRVILVRKPFPWNKWIGVVLLLVGPTLVELGSVRTHGEGEGEGRGEPAPIYWHMLTLFGAFVSSCANIYMEWVYKRFGKDSVHLQNSQLFAWSSLFAFIVLNVREGPKRALEVLDPETVVQRLNFVGVLALFLQTFSAFIAPIILKYIDNIAEVVAHALALILTMLGSWALFKERLTWQFQVGSTVSIVAITVYYLEKLDLDPQTTPKSILRAVAAASRS